MLLVNTICIWHHLLICSNQVGGNHIRVDRACPPRKKLKGDNPPLYESKRTVFLGNLPFDVKVRFSSLK